MLNTLAYVIRTVAFAHDASEGESKNAGGEVNQVLVDHDVCVFGCCKSLEQDYKSMDHEWMVFGYQICYFVVTLPTSTISNGCITSFHVWKCFFFSNRLPHCEKLLRNR